MDDFLKNGTKNKNKKNAWLVISDRDNNAVYDKPGDTSPKGVVNFRDWFYVTDETDDYVQIVEASGVESNLKLVNVKKMLGWIKKTNVIPWNTGLVDPLSLINRKAFLLNKATDIENILKSNDKTIVPIYSGPDTDNQLDPLRIFDFYFVMKVDTKRKRLLISSEANISPLNVEKIIGWVEDRRCTRWDTRICLEPNYAKDAFAERKGNDKLRLKVFGDDSNARDFLNTPDKAQNVIFSDDPVTFPAEKMSKGNPNRYGGQVIRMPMLELLRDDIFKTGLIGSVKIKKGSFISEMKETALAPIDVEVDKTTKKTKNVNVFFLIEATDSVYAFQPSIVKAMETINKDLTKDIPNMQFGALLYRDIPEGEKITEYVRLSSDFDRVKSFVQDASFRNVGDTDDYVAYYYGLSQALRLGGFNENETNIIILIGSHGDYRADPVRKEAAKKESHKSYIADPQSLFESLSKFDAHLYAVQLCNHDDKASEFFTKNIQRTIIEAAKYGYNSEYGNRGNEETKAILDDLEKRGIKCNEPEMASPPYAVEDIALVNGIYPGKMIVPALGKHVGVQQLSNLLKSFVQSSLEHEKSLNDIVKKIFVQGEDLSPETFSDLKVDGGRMGPALAKLLNDMVKSSKISDENLIKALDDKYKLYVEGYVPKTLANAQSDLLKYVLFMPENDLREYKRVVSKGIVSATTYDKKRELLFEIYKEIIVQFAGEKRLREKKAEDWTREEMLELVQGIHMKGLRIDGVGLDIRILDIKDAKKTPNQVIDELLLRFKEIDEKLSSVLRNSDTYEYAYTSDQQNVYYWIEMSDLTF
jgi:hypothetical protein